MLDFTDNSTGTDGALVADVVLPSAVIDASGSSVGAPKAGLDTATTKKARQHIAMKIGKSDELVERILNAQEAGNRLIRTELTRRGCTI